MEFIRSINFEPGAGIVCANDSTAAILMSSLDEIGLTVGKDLLICGYDDMKYGRHLKYPLTSYWQPCEDMAKVSIELIMRRLANPSATTVTATISGNIIKRDSTQFVL